MKTIPHSHEHRTGFHSFIHSFICCVILKILKQQRPNNLEDFISKTEKMDGLYSLTGAKQSKTFSNIFISELVYFSIYHLLPQQPPFLHELYFM